MLKDINKRRPDRQLERSLVFLAYSIMFMSLSLLALFLWPQYFIYIIVSIVVWNMLCILVTIRILKVSENAIGFGALAAEILNDKTKYHRVDNAIGEAILMNKPAFDYFQNMPILSFLERNIVDSSANKLDLQKLVSAVNNLQSTSVTLSVNQKKDSVFVAEEWLRVTVKPIYLSKADIFEDKFSLKKIRKETYIFWTIENITAYKNMDKVFKDELSSLHYFLDYLPVGLYTCNSERKIEYINNTLAEKLNTDKNDAVEKTLDDFIAYKPEILHTETGEYEGGVLFKDKKGRFEAYVRQQNVRENGDLKTRGVVIWNLPGDEQLRTDLNKMTDLYDWIFSSAPIGIIFADKQQHILEINDYAVRLFEKSADDIKLKKLSAYFNDDAKNKIKKIFAENTSNDNAADFETILASSAEEKNVQISVRPMQFNYAQTTDVTEGFIVYLTDNTSKRNLEMQVAQAQKMQAFGQLAGGVAHDFNNLLTAVIGYCDLLIQRHGVGDPSFSDLVQLKYNVNRAVGVARQLLAISRKQPLNPKLVDVTEAFAELDHLLSRLLGEQIKFKITYGQDLGYIRVDRVQFSQVMINLVINAKDAMNGKGTLSIAIRSERLNQPYRFGADLIKPGDFVVISVTDTGCGIPPENMERIFEPFFSTKKNIVGSGTGLGLAMVYGIVRQTEGFIKVHSEVGVGTTFEIYLPSYEKNENSEEKTPDSQEEIILDKSGKAAMTTAPIAVNQDNKLILGLNISSFDTQRTLARNPGEIKILFVEDEDAVRIVGARGLRQRGFAVVDCVSAENALTHIENDEKFDMMITDMMMPGMSGADLAKIAHQKQPDMIILLASGYSEEIARKELAGSQDFYFISKPYSLDDLHKKVKEILEQS